MQQEATSIVPGLFPDNDNVFNYVLFTRNRITLLRFCLPVRLGRSGHDIGLRSTTTTIDWLPRTSTLFHWYTLIYGFYHRIPAPFGKFTLPWQEIQFWIQKPMSMCSSEQPSSNIKFQLFAFQLLPVFHWL